MTIFGGSKETLAPQLQPDCCSLWPNILILQERWKDKLYVKSLLFVKHSAHKIKWVSAPAAVQSLPGCASLDPGLLQERSPVTQDSRESISREDGVEKHFQSIRVKAVHFWGQLRNFLPFTWIIKSRKDQFFTIVVGSFSWRQRLDQTQETHFRGDGKVTHFTFAFNLGIMNTYLKTR